MKTDQNHRFFSRGKLVRALLMISLVGAGSVYFLTKISTSEPLLETLGTLVYAWALLGIGAEILSFWGSGYRIKFILSDDNAHFSAWRGILIVMASGSLGVVSGGWVSYAAASVYFASKEVHDPGTAPLAGILPTMFNMGLLVITTVGSLLYLLLNHEITRAQVLFYGFFLLIIGLGVLLLILSLVRRQQMMRVLLWTAEKLSQFKTLNIEGIRQKIESAYPKINTLSRRRWVQIAIGSCLWTLLDLLSLFFFFKAAGYQIKPGILIAGYSIAFILGKAAFFAPGGAGVVESSMALIFYNLGVPYHYSTVAILGFRLVSFWIPGILGFPAVFYLQKSKKPA